MPRYCCFGNSFILLNVIVVELQNFKDCFVWNTKECQYCIDVLSVAVLFPCGSFSVRMADASNPIFFRMQRMKTYNIPLQHSRMKKLTFCDHL
jgi:hypothetical protein